MTTKNTHLWRKQPGETVTGYLLLIESKKHEECSPVTLFLYMLVFTLLLWCLSVVCTGALCTEPELSSAGPSKLNLMSTPLVSFVWLLLPPTSPRHVQGPESQHVHRAGDFLVQLGHQSGEDVESKGLSQSPCRGWYKYFIRPLRWFLNKLMDDKCIQISRKLWSQQTALKSFSESNDQRDRPAGPQISFEDQPHHFPVALFTPCHQNKTATKKGSLSLFICCHQSVRKMDGFWRWFQSSALRVQLKTHSRCWKHTAQEFIHSAGAKLD